MKITAYGYYNYNDIHDKREHLTLTPLREIELKQGHDYSGNRYEFETQLELEYAVHTEKAYDTEWKEDRMRIKGEGGIDMEIFTENGIAILMPLNRAYWDTEKVILGNVKKHKINENKGY